MYQVIFYFIHYERRSSVGSSGGGVRYYYYYYIIIIDFGGGVWFVFVCSDYRLITYYYKILWKLTNLRVVGNS